MPMLAHYPFQIHALHHPSVTWDAITGGYLRSKTPTCTGYALEGGACGSCASLRSNACLRDVINRASNCELHLTTTSNDYLTAEQQTARFRVHVERESLYRVMLFRGDLRVSRLLQRMDTHKRILLALSERNVPRVHALLLAELKDGSSPKAILAAV
jgi:hypothetical protein